MTDGLMSREEVAALLGIRPNSVRDTLRRAGITEVRGYPRDAVEALAKPGARPGRGARTDLRRRLCAHADLNGEGAHWLEPGERCPRLDADRKAEEMGHASVRDTQRRYGDA